MMATREFRARWIVPPAGSPVEGGSVLLTDGAFPLTEAADRPDGLVDLGDFILCPAPVNTHTHLEWSWLAGRAPHADRFIDWVRAILSLELPSPEVIESAAREAAASLRAQGGRLVGNVSGSLRDAASLADLGGCLFHELIGLPEGRAGELFESATARLASLALPSGLRASLSPHGPHTVSRSLLRRLARSADRISIHASESAEEEEFLKTGGGAFRALHEERGGWDGSWRPPGESAVEYLARSGLLGPRTLLVHGVHLSGSDIARLAITGTPVAICPRSNRLTGAGTAPLTGLLRTGVTCTLATDSLASNDDLDMACELAAARSTWPGVAPAALVEMATVAGWRVLRETGGEGPAAACVRIPPGLPASADPYRILCGDYGPVRFEALPPHAWD
jgi:cytosine/adenosine deaminase-related metal-dependent hydrolase